MPGPAGRQEIEIVTTRDRSCPRCGGEILAVLQFPNGWTRENGQQVRGTAQTLLCGHCDRDDPVTGPIVMYFTVHGQVVDTAVDEFAGLLRRWATHVTEQKLDEQTLDAEVDAWYRGEL